MSPQFRYSTNLQHLGKKVASTTKNLKNPENLNALNENGNREKEDRREVAEATGSERRKVQRRRLIDPTTCERDYTNDEIEFMQEMDEYKRRSGRMFPTCSEILEVLRGMGYLRVELPNEEDEEEIANNEAVAPVRTAGLIASELDQFDEFDEEFEAEALSDFEDDE